MSDTGIDVDGPVAARLIGAWDPAAAGASHGRLAALVAALEGSPANADGSLPGDTHTGDTLGDRNRRLLALQRELIGTPLEARVACRRCGVESEFRVPIDAIGDLPRPDRGVRVSVRLVRRRYTFRLPTMADLEAAGGYSGAREVRLAVIARCRIDGGGGEIPELVAHRLAARFEALDPAANVVVNVACSGCASPLAVSVDVARFVAQSIDRLVDGLLREVHMFAAAYGWDEARVLSLPAWRRRRYLELIASSRFPALPADVRQVAVSSR
jgi:hypothetical protein